LIGEFALLRRLIAGMTLEGLPAPTDPRLKLAPNWQVLTPPEAPKARAAQAVLTF
jgi:hypothetical protein